MRPENNNSDISGTCPSSTIGPCVFGQWAAEPSFWEQINDRVTKKTEILRKLNILNKLSICDAEISQYKFCY